MGALPLWAKKHISDDTGPPVPFSKGVAAPKGRWAQRAERSVGMKSIYTDSIISFSSLHGKCALCFLFCLFCHVMYCFLFKLFYALH